ncbi:MAG: hypothetical protein IJ950_01570 [Helicobacter sp.]|nr:hypothetical protein [Helicobacter sp.]
MKKSLRSKKYCYYCNHIRAQYQEKRRKKTPKKLQKRINKNIQNLIYESLELGSKQVNKIIKDVESFSQKRFQINFRKLERFDLGLCLLFTSLLEYFSEKENISFGFAQHLMPKNKRIRNMFKQTGIFKILCGKDIAPQAGKMCILKVSINNQEQVKDILLKISQEIVEYSLKLINNNSKQAKNYLNKIFEELLLNVKSHAKTNDMVYLAGEIDKDIIRFAILDKGIGFAKAIQSRNNIRDKFLDKLEKNYVRMIFETKKEKDRNYSGEHIRRGNGTRRLEESIRKCKGAKVQIVSKKDFYELVFNQDTLGFDSNSTNIKDHNAIGTLVSFELPIREFLQGVCNDNI